ncbi:interleukin-6 receptor subunit beta, partial [Plakobranchus ocellatus]
KPSPVENLEIKPTKVGNEKQCLDLTWTHRKPNAKKVFRVRHKADGDKNFSVLGDGLDTSSFLACGYDPMTQHIFAIDCYPVGSYKGYWSDPLVKEITTPQAEPLLGPQISNGSYLTTACNHGFRNITVLWNDVKKEAQNGIITHISFWVNGKFQQKNIFSRYSASLKITCGEVSLQLRAHNAAGFSLVPSTLIIPSVELEVPLVLHETFSVEVTREANLTTELHAVWQTPGEEEASAWGKATVFWCLGKWLKKQCTGPVYWAVAEPSQKYMNISADIIDATEFLFGISVEYKTTQKWSPIFWTSCLYDNRAVEVPAPSNLDLEADEEAIKTWWSPVLCSYQSRVKVDKYIVKWRKADAGENEFAEKAVDSSTSFYHIASLEAQTPYLVTVQSKSAYQLGEQTEWKKVMPLKKTNMGLFIASIVGSILSVAVVAVAIFLLIRYCYRHRRSMNMNVKAVEDLKSNSQNFSTPYCLLSKGTHESEFLFHPTAATFRGLARTTSLCDVICTHNAVTRNTKWGSHDETMATSNDLLIKQRSVIDFWQLRDILLQTFMQE